MRLLLLLLFPFSLFSQVPWVDPQEIIEHMVIPGVDSVSMKMVAGPNMVPIYHKQYYKDTWSMARVEKRDLKKKVLYLAEYNQDSTAFTEYKIKLNQLREPGKYVRSHVFYKNGWEFEDGLLLSAVSSEMQGKHLIIYHTDNDYEYDAEDRVVKMISIYSADYYKYERKTIVEYKYNDLDSVIEEKQVTYRGIIPLHRGKKKYVYNEDEELVETIIKTNGHTERRTYEYNGWGMVLTSVAYMGEKTVTTNYEYDDSTMIRKEVISVDNGTAHRKCYYYNSHGMLEILVKQRDSMVYEHFDNDTIRSIVRYKMDKNWEVIREEPILSQTYKNGKLVERSYYDYSRGKVVLDLETYQYDDEGRLIKYVLKKSQNTQPLYDLEKKYEYGPRGYLYKVEVTYPRSGVTNTFIYDVSF